MGYYVIGVIVWGCIWGFATDKVIANKGYEYENWFWWGFFFGFIAFFVACAKPEYRTYSYSEPSFVSDKAASIRRRDMLENGGWECAYCKRFNPDYTSTCACGRTKDETIDRNRKMREERIDRMREGQSQKSTNADELLKYKKLLDAGAITQEEYDMKKKQLLEL